MYFSTVLLYVPVGRNLHLPLGTFFRNSECNQIFKFYIENFVKILWRKVPSCQIQYHSNIFHIHFPVYHFPTSTSLHKYILTSLKMSSRGASDQALQNYLLKNGWPTGLRNMLAAGLISTPSRFFICDDSGSMMSSDGHRLTGNGSSAK